jgi:hypothetical protein
MSAETLLSRLEKPRVTGRGTWLCRCPSHADKSPSMTVRECDDGRVLVHCFAGCSVNDILGSVGLEFDALFPPKPIEHAKPLRRPFPAADVLEAVMHDALVVQQVAVEVQRTGELLPYRRELLSEAVARIAEAHRCVNG